MEFWLGKTSFATGIYLGKMFDDNTGVLSPDSEIDLPAVLCFSRSDGFREAIRDVDQELYVTIGNCDKITLDLDSWRAVAAEKYPLGLPKPNSHDPTRWLFNGHPAGGNKPLHVALPHMLGYQLATPDRFKLFRLPCARPGWFGKVCGWRLYRLYSRRPWRARRA